MKSMEQIALINKVNLSVLDEVESNFHLVLNSMQEQSSASKDGEQSWASKDEEQSRFAIFKDSKYLRLLLLVTVC